MITCQAALDVRLDHPILINGSWQILQTLNPLKCILNLNNDRLIKAKSSSGVCTISIIALALIRFLHLYIPTYMQSHGFSQSSENMEIGSVNSIGHNYHTRMNIIKQQKQNSDTSLFLFSSFWCPYFTHFSQN